MKIKRFGVIRCEKCTNAATMFIEFYDGEKLILCHGCLHKYRKTHELTER